MEQVKKAKSHVPSPALFEYSAKDACLYALGVGADAKDDLHFVYEGHPDFQVLPSFVVVPGLQASSLVDWPGIEFDLTRVLHGESYIELFAPLPPDGTQLRSETRVADVLDKGKAALIITEVTTYDAQSGDKLAFQQFGIMQIGSGGFGGNRSSPAERQGPPVPTERKPDFVMEHRTHSNQAAVYRLGSGDLNPLHIDPDFARKAGFQRPILHGLCSLGITTRLLIRAFGKNQAKCLKAIKVRFSAPVEPGQTLVVEVWRNGEEVNKVLFQAKVKETGKVVLSNGFAEFTAPLHVEASKI